MGEATHAEGYGAIAYEDYAHAEGCDTFAHDWVSHAEGEGCTQSIKLTGAAGSYEYTVSVSNDRYFKYFGKYLFVVYNGKYIQIEEWNNETKIVTLADTLDENNDLNEAEAYLHYGGIATNSAHVEGSCSVAIGWYSHAEGLNSVTLYDGDNAHAEGGYATAAGYASHCEGSDNIAADFADHAEGSTTYASGGASHTEGDSTATLGYASHAEG
jgi:hypothetical protein